MSAGAADKVASTRSSRANDARESFSVVAPPHRGERLLRFPTAWQLFGSQPVEPLCFPSRSGTPSPKPEVTSSPPEKRRTSTAAVVFGVATSSSSCVLRPFTPE